MGIAMIGIDHSMAPVDIRSVFAFTKKNAALAMERIAALEGINGCVLLSTCNRMELWISGKNTEECFLYETLCEEKEVDPSLYHTYFVFREQEEAVRHLFYLTSGLKSQIVGEDQILTQVKDALQLAREHYAADGVLEVLFRMAVTAGKRIKTEAVFSHGNASVIHKAVENLKRDGVTLKGAVCMVIGNGAMGKVAAQTLVENGALVTVTVRQYKSGMVEIPSGCSRIHYGERLEFLPKCRLVVSATASPNLTIQKEQMENCPYQEGLILIDLAVPRDIEPSVRELPGICLYDMDSFSEEGNLSGEQLENLKKADKIVQEQIEEFAKWYEGRELIPRIQKMKQEAVQDFHLRIEKPLKKMPLEAGDRSQLQDAVEHAADGVINKLIFGLRDSLDQDVFLKCVEGLEKLYE